MIRRGAVLAGTYEARWQLAAPWGARGYVSDLGGPVHWIEFGAQTAGPPVVFVHGLGGSHLNWALVGSQLAADRRALALDLRGFGLTPSRRRDASVAGNVTLLDQFITEIAGEPVVLIGNSMGGMISILQAHAHPDSVAGLVLIAPALPSRLRSTDLRVASQFMLYALPGAGEAWLRAMRTRMPPRVLVQRVIELCFADPARADPAMIDAAVALALVRQDAEFADEALLVAARSLMRVAGQAGRYRAIMAGLGAPVLLIGGTSDRLVPVASIREAGRRNAGWQTVIMDGVGHTPQLETPAAVVTLVADWLGQHVPASDAEG